MQVSTVTTSDHSLLRHVRGTITGADDLLFCVAFVQSKGVRLIDKELEASRKERKRARLLATNVFQSSDANAIDAMADLGVEVRPLNPGSGQTYQIAEEIRSAMHAPDRTAMGLALTRILSLRC